MPSDALNLRANCLRFLGQYWNAAPTLFAKRLAVYKDSDFYFTLDEVGILCERDKYQDLLYIVT